MSEPASGKPRVWWATLGKWSALKKKLQRFDSTTRTVLQQKATGLVGRLAQRVPNFDAGSFVEKALPAAASGLPAKQFEEVLDLAQRLGGEHINPTGTLFHGVPALSGNSNSPKAFSTNLLYLEALVTQMHQNKLDIGKPLWAAVRSAAKEIDTRQLTSSLVLANRLAENAVDPTEVLRFSVTTAANVLTEQQFRLAMNLSAHAVKRGCYVAELLSSELPEVSRKVSPGELTAALRLAVHLEDKKVGLKDFFKKALPAIVECSPTPEDYEQNLELISTLVIQLLQRDIFIDPPLRAMASGCDKPDDFRNNVQILYRFCVAMAAQGVDVKKLLQHGFPAAIHHTPQTFQSSLQNLLSVITRLREAGIDPHLLTFLVNYGLDRVNKNSASAADFKKHLVALLQSFRQLVLKDIDADHHKKALGEIQRSSVAFLRITEPLNPQLLIEGGLVVFYEIATSVHYDWRSLDAKQLAALCEQAVPLIKKDKRFVIEIIPGQGPKITPVVEGHAAFRSRVRGKQQTSKPKSDGEKTPPAGPDPAPTPRRINP